MSLDEKAGKVSAIEESLTKAKADAKAKALEAEKATYEARIAAAQPEVEETPEEETPEEAPTEDVVAEGTTETVEEEKKEDAAE